MLEKSERVRYLRTDREGADDFSWPLHHLRLCYINTKSITDLQGNRRNRIDNILERPKKGGVTLGNSI